MQRENHNGGGSTAQELPGWTLVTSHGLVLLYVAVNPDATIREVSERLGLTERRIADIIRDLSKANVTLVKIGFQSLSRPSEFPLTMP